MVLTGIGGSYIAMLNRVLRGFVLGLEWQNAKGPSAGIFIPADEPLLIARPRASGAQPFVLTAAFGSLPISFVGQALWLIRPISIS